MEVIALLSHHHQHTPGADMALQGSISRLKKKTKALLSSRGRPEKETSEAGSTNSRLPEPNPRVRIAEVSRDANLRVGEPHSM